MALIITNRATLNYRYGLNTASILSNVANATVNSPLTLTKTALGDVYRLDQNITYIISLGNNSNTSKTGLTISDNLGTFTENRTEITPLSYIGNAKLYINGSFVENLVPDMTASEITFEIPSLPAGGNALIIYQAKVNSFAPLDTGAEITNIATLNACVCSCEQEISASAVITADRFADVRMTKTAIPSQLSCGEEITYNFDIFNYGNANANEVTLNDLFDPMLSNISVSVNGVAIANSDYDYTAGILTLPNNSGDEITVPAAIFGRDGDTGAVTVSPGKATIVVKGNI